MVVPDELRKIWGNHKFDVTASRLLNTIMDNDFMDGIPYETLKDWEINDHDMFILNKSRSNIEKLIDAGLMIDDRCIVRIISSGGI